MLRDSSNDLRRVRFKQRQVGLNLLINTNTPGTRGAWVEAHSENSGARYQLGSRIVLKVEAGTDASALAALHGSKIARTVTSDLFILEASNSGRAIDVAEALAKESGVVDAYPVMRSVAG